MPTFWRYGRENYDTLAEAEAAVLEMKNKLDNCPTNWCGIKRATPDGNGGYVLSELLTDEEINNLDDSAVYNAWCVLAGDNLLAVDADTVRAKILEWRQPWAVMMEVDDISHHWEPTNEDMSGYV